MLKHLLQTEFYAAIAGMTMIIAGIIGMVRVPSKMLTNAMLHFAAGVVFSAVAVELLPVVLNEHRTFALTIGFLIGVFVMLLIKYSAEKLEQRDTSTHGVPMGLIIAVTVDLFIDGLLMGIAFYAGARRGILIAIALIIEVFFVGLSTITTLATRRVSSALKFFCIVLLAIVMPIGAAVGTTVIQLIPISLLTGALAFGVAALLYLVVEELLIEAHKTEEKPLVTAMFFLDFLIILLLETII